MSKGKPDRKKQKYQKKKNTTKPSRVSSNRLQKTAKTPPKQNQEAPLFEERLKQIAEQNHILNDKIRLNNSLISTWHGEAGIRFALSADIQRDVEAINVNCLQLEILLQKQLEHLQTQDVSSKIETYKQIKRTVPIIEDIISEMKSETWPLITHSMRYHLLIALQDFIKELESEKTIGMIDDQ